MEKSWYIDRLKLVWKLDVSLEFLLRFFSLHLHTVHPKAWGLINSYEWCWYLSHTVRDMVHFVHERSWLTITSPHSHLYLIRFKRRSHNTPWWIMGVFSDGFAVTCREAAVDAERHVLLWLLGHWKYNSHAARSVVAACLSISNSQHYPRENKNNKGFGGRRTEATEGSAFRHESDLLHQPQQDTWHQPCWKGDLHMKKGSSTREWKGLSSYQQCHHQVNAFLVKQVSRFCAEGVFMCTSSTLCNRTTDQRRHLTRLQQEAQDSRVNPVIMRRLLA